MSLRSYRKRDMARVVSIIVLVAFLVATTGIGYAAPNATVSRRAGVPAAAAPSTPSVSTPARPTLPKVGRRAPAAASSVSPVPAGRSSIVLPECDGWIHVYKWVDYDGDQVWDADEPAKEGWHFTVRKLLRTWTLVTDATGHASMQAEVGTYLVTEEARIGWTWLLPQVVCVANEATVSLYFGNHECTLTKGFSLRYPGAPADASFYAVVKGLLAGPVTIPLVSDPSSGAYVGSRDVLWHSVITVEWWMSRTGGDVLLGTTGPECLDRDITNEFEYDSSLSGTKFEDLDGDGARDPGEPGLPGWTIRLLPAVVGIAPTSVPWIAEATTAADGSYSFSQLPPGAYTVEEVLKEGWTQTLAPTGSFRVGDGVHTAGLDFGNYRVDVKKIFELRMDAAKSGVTFSVDYSVNGDWTSTDLASGSSPLIFSGEETLKWGDTVGSVEWYAHYGTEKLLLGSTPGETLAQLETLNSLYYDPSIGGSKFNDTDGDGVWDAGEPGLEGWTIQLWRLPAQQVSFGVDTAGTGMLYDETVTASDGSYEFVGVLPGEYYVTEVLQDGWQQTLAPLGTFDVTNGTQISTLDFGNVRLYPDLMLDKAVDPTLVARGDIITYTLTWENVGDYLAAGYTVTDDFDERYVEVVDAAGGVVSDGKIVWTFAGPLAPGDAPMTVTYTLRVLDSVPEDVTLIDNTAVIEHPEDTDLTNNSDDASVEVEPFAPFTPKPETETETETDEEPFLPFTGADALLLLAIAGSSAALGLLLRRRTA